MKIKRNVTIAALALTAVSLSSVSMITAYAQTAEEQAIVNTMTNGFAFDGAGVQRVKGDDGEYSYEKSGLRFSVTLTEEAYTLAVEKGYTVGMLLVPKLVLEGAGRDASYITYENAKDEASASSTDVVKKDLPLDGWMSETVDGVTTYSDYVYLYNFKAEQFDYEIYAKGYGLGAGEDVIYTEDPRGNGLRSIAYVCNGLIDNAADYGYDDAMVNFLAGYLPTYTVSFMDGETVVDSQSVKYGSVAEAPTAPEKAGYTFKGWVDAEGNAFDFDKEIVGQTTVYASYEKEVILLTQEMVDNNLRPTRYTGLCEWISGYEKVM